MYRNKFTTLEGVEFQWSIENLAQSQSANQVLRFITFIDSPYETPTTVAKFDSLGLRGHKVLIEGVKTGAAKVSVQLPHPEYNKVPKIEVVLTVVANLLLDPPDTHILAGDTVKFRLLQKQIFEQYRAGGAPLRKGGVWWGVGPAPSCIGLSAVWIVFRLYSFVYTAATLTWPIEMCRSFLTRSIRTGQSSEQVIRISVSKDPPTEPDQSDDQIKRMPSTGGDTGRGQHTASEEYLPDPA
ncbi:hypothetical protein J6590_002773 [Homalodisca vitripennis]|nr:hypothetical protein J6590_002773 [Homalodisca vitripennis]